jgi:autotransporter passenger strand-loop-strand repeat protein
VLAGGSANDTTVNSGGLQYVDGVVEGFANNTVVNSGGLQQVAAGGTANGATVNSGGTQQVLADGVASGTALDGGTQVVSSGGTAAITTINAGGVQQVQSGSFVTDTTVNSGGTLTGDGDVAGVTVTSGGLVSNLASASLGIVDNGGTVQVDGLTAADVAINEGGVLSGTGMLTGNATINAGGTLAAATPGGTLRVSGKLAFNDGARYAVTVDANGTNGRTAVTGDVGIAAAGANGGVKVVVNAAPGAWQPNTTYTILTYSGTLSGTFAGVTSDYAYLSPTLSYAPNEVDLKLSITSLFYMTGQFSGFGLVGQTTNQLQAASALTRIYTAGGNAITAAMLTETVDGARSALSQMAGDEAAGMLDVARQNTDALTQVVTDRLTEAGMQRPASDLWASVRHGESHVSGDSSLGSTSISAHSDSLAVGFDHPVAPGVRVGVALDADYNDLGFGEPGASGHVDGWQALLYGAWQPADQPFFVKAMFGMGHWSNTIDRSVSFGGLGGTPHDSFATHAASAYAEGGMNLHLRDDMALQPYLALRLGHYAQDGFTESGGNLFNLVYQGSGQAATTGVAGLRYLFTRQRLDGNADTWQVDVNVQQRFGKLDQSQNTAFANAPGELYQVSGTPLARTVGHVGTGGRWQFGSHASVFAHLSADVGKNEHDYSGVAGVNWKW